MILYQPDRQSPRVPFKTYLSLRIISHSSNFSFNLLEIVCQDTMLLPYTLGTDQELAISVRFMEYLKAPLLVLFFSVFLSFYFTLRLNSSLTDCISYKINTQTSDGSQPLIKRWRKYTVQNDLLHIDDWNPSSRPDLISLLFYHENNLNSVFIYSEAAAAC